MSRLSLLFLGELGYWNQVSKASNHLSDDQSILQLLSLFVHKTRSGRAFLFCSSQSIAPSLHEVNKTLLPNFAPISFLPHVLYESFLA